MPSILLIRRGSKEVQASPVLARDAQAKLALIIAQCLSIHLSICVSVRDSLSHAYVRSIARREPRRLPACFQQIFTYFRHYITAECKKFAIIIIIIGKDQCRHLMRRSALLCTYITRDLLAVNFERKSNFTLPPHEPCLPRYVSYPGCFLTSGG